MLLATFVKALKLSLVDIDCWGTKSKVHVGKTEVGSGWTIC